MSLSSDQRGQQRGISAWGRAAKTDGELYFGICPMLSCWLRQMQPHIDRIELLWKGKMMIMRP
jgi:hypothetical protein